MRQGRVQEIPFEIDEPEPLYYEDGEEDEGFDVDAFELALSQERKRLGLTVDESEQPHFVNGLDFDALAYGRYLTLARAGTRKLGAGDKDKDAVRALQESLSAAGYELEVDGIFDSATESAVREFQKDNGLPVTGKMGEKDVDKLNKESKQKSSNEPSSDPTIDAAKPFVATGLPERDKNRQDRKDQRQQKRQETQTRRDARQSQEGDSGDSDKSSSGSASSKRPKSAETPARQAPSNPEFERKHDRGQGGRFVSQGSAGQIVTGVQRELGIKTDGKYGPKTEAAVEDYQKQNGLQVDGIVGSQTASSLLGDKQKDPGTLTQPQINALSSTASIKRANRRKKG